jgi:4-diphosphocytidyl-2-C-methyl-D-erythritol kinase
VEAPGGENNLAYRAAAAFAHEASFGGRVEIKLRKNIPVGSGLGGGSSDAATVLVALNALTGKTLSNSNLITIGSRIGADVPLFVVGSAAVIRGIGDIVEQVLLPSQLNLVLCSDRHVLSTKDVFSRVKLSLTTGTQLTRIRKFLNGGAPIPEILHNDLELAASMLHPEITKIKRRLLERGATAALMTGSGSAVFGLCADAESAGTIARYLREEGYWAEAVQTCGPGGGSCDGR